MPTLERHVAAKWFTSTLPSDRIAWVRDTESAARSVEEVCVTRSQQAIGSHKDFLMMVKGCNVQLYGQIFHSSSLAKTHLATPNNQTWKKTKADTARGGNIALGNGKTLEFHKPH